VTCAVSKTELAARHVLDILRLVKDWMPTERIVKSLEDNNHSVRSQHDYKGALTILDTLAAADLVQRKAVHKGYQWRAL